MKKYLIETPDFAQKSMDLIYSEIHKRAILKPTGACPVELTLGFVRLCHSQSCGKCTPCRIGLEQIAKLLEQILKNEATREELNLIESTAKTIADTSDCCIGYKTAEEVLKALEGFKEDFISHIENSKCIAGIKSGIPCQEACPAHVDIPGYISLTADGKYDEAMALIRKDNPFPSVCGYICEHPCEKRCRRSIIDSPINICGIKRFAADYSSEGEIPEILPETGKKIAVIGGGPAGLTTAYYLSLMGHKVTIFEQREKLGGMLRYGIPDYRLPPNVLDKDINFILRTGITVNLNAKIHDEAELNNIKDCYDAVYIAIGAHLGKKMGINGEEAQNVLSAVEFLRTVGDGQKPDMTGKCVCVVGGGNVAMDCSRTCLRLGAKKVICVYRRRVEDMTALPEEIEEAKAEGVEMLPLYAPDHIESDSTGKVSALYVQKQIISAIGEDGRPTVKKANAPSMAIPCDYVIGAIGQAIESKPFEILGIKTNRSATICADETSFTNNSSIFSGGDAVSGPATVIKAIAAGKVAAHNIDKFLGFDHELKCDIDIPEAGENNKEPYGRVNLRPRRIENIVNDFNIVSDCMSSEECEQECSRCLRCDGFGFGSFKYGRNEND